MIENYNFSDLVEIVKILIDNNAKLDRGYYSELYEALKNKNPDFALYLINHGANINYEDMINMSEKERINSLDNISAEVEASASDIDYDPDKDDFDEFFDEFN